MKKIIKKLFHLIGFEVKRISQGKYQRNSLLGVLSQAKSMGILPATVIDVGAAYGSFTLQCHNVFPDARYILVEPLEEYKPFIEQASKSIANAEFILAAATAESGEITINVHADLVGSSLYLEGEDSNVNGVPRSVQAIPLDYLINDTEIKGPVLLKIDVQGAELDVLKGAEEILRKSEYVLLEVSLFQFFKGGAQFYDVVTFMKTKDFVPYDMYELQYRPLDNALSQIDIGFVKENGLFRKYHYYATPEQREQQNRKFEIQMRKNIKRYKLQ